MVLIRTLKKRLTRCFSKKPQRTQPQPIFRSGWAERSIGATYFYPLHPKLRLQIRVMQIIKEEEGGRGVDVGVDVDVKMVVVMVEKTEG